MAYIDGNRDRPPGDIDCDGDGGGGGTDDLGLDDAATPAVVDGGSVPSPLCSPASSHSVSPPESPCLSRTSVPDSSSLPRRVALELREQLRTSIPAIIGLVLYKIPWLLSLSFVGRIGPMELAAAALASAMCDVTGMSVSLGLSSAITTLTGQARGDLLAMGEAMRKDADFKRRLLERAKESERWGRRSSKVADVGGAGEGSGAGETRRQTFNRLEDESIAETIRTGTVAADEEKISLLSTRKILSREVAKISPQSDYGNVGACTDDVVDNGTAFHRRGERMLLNMRSNSSHYQSFLSSASVESDTEEAPLLPMVFLYRGIFVQLCLVIPVGIWWLRGVYPVLIKMGQPEDLSAMTQTYLRILTPGLWSYSINWTLTAWLQAIEMADVPTFAALIGCLLHVPFNLLFIYVFGWGWLGVGAATVMFQVVQPTTMFIYLFGTRRGNDRLLEQLGAKGIGRTDLSFRAEVYAAVSSVSGIYQYLELAIPGVIVISEWWASEVAIFLAGRLEPNPEFALSGMAIYQTILSACFMFPYGISVGGSTRVGNLLGANDSEGAALASRVCVGSSALISCISGSILYLTPHTFLPSLFSPDEDVIEQTSLTITLLSIYVFADGFQVALNGIVKGCGRQCITVPIVITAYWVVGVPLAYCISFKRHGGYMCQDAYFCGIVGLVGGMTAGTWVHFLLLWAAVVCTIDWEKEANRARERLSQEAQKGWNIGTSMSKDIEGFGDGSRATDIREEIRILHRGTYLRLMADDNVSLASVKSM